VENLPDIQTVSAIRSLARTWFAVAVEQTSGRHTRCLSGTDGERRFKLDLPSGDLKCIGRDLVSHPMQVSMIEDIVTHGNKSYKCMDLTKSNFFSLEKQGITPQDFHFQEF